MDRLATSPRAGRVLASSTAKGIPGARLDWSAGSPPLRPLVQPHPAPPGASGRPVVPCSRFPVRPSVRPSVRPFARPFVCPFQVWAEALFSPRDRQLHCNQPQPGSSETQILHKSRQRAAPPVALVHIWRLNPSTGGDAGAGGTPRRTRCCHLDPRQRLSGLRWTCLRGEGVCDCLVWYRAGEVYPSSDAEQYRGSGEAEVRSLPCTDL